MGTDTSPLIIRNTARVVLVNSLTKSCLLLQINCPNQCICWITPGGKIEEGETALTAAQRELQEETGIAEARFFASPSWFFEHTLELKGEPTLFKEHVFVAHTHQSAIVISKEEQEYATTFKWWRVSELIKTHDKVHPLGLLPHLTTFMKNV